MTREEAIQGLKAFRREFSGYKPNEEMLDMAIKALEQEPKSEWTHDHEILRAYADGANNVLEKISAEIEQIEINGHIRDVECFRAGINTALNIINKYKSETER